MQPPRVALPPSIRDVGFTPAHARSEGIGRGRLRGRDLHHPFQGVYLTAAIDLDVPELCAALSVRVPQNSFFCGPTAAMLWGIPLPRRLEHEYTTHIAVPAPATAPVGRGVTGHSYRVVDRELTTLSGLRLSSPARTWCELSFLLSLDELIIAGDYLIHHERDLSSSHDIALLVQRFPSRKGRPTRLRALTELHDRSESPQETRLRLLVTRAGLHGIEVNFPIRTSGGFDYRADLAFPALRVVIEYQSAFHDSPARIQSDRTRRSRLEADEWRVIEVGAEDLRAPDELLARLRRTLAARSGLATFAP